MSRFAFDVSIYGLEELSPVLSQARVRLFYKGLNRNYTYITDEFAEKLLKTLPYTPVIGKFEDGDFTNHGRNGEQLQVYGVVPETPNVTWEDHLDKDDVTRTYACCDVLLFTGRFPEAKIIASGTAQSMELYDKSVKGDWVYENGKKFYRFDDACFIGVCALGENTEPCFEGAAFYEYASSLREVIEEIKKYNNGGGATMDIQFKLSDSQKLNMLFDLINSEGYFENTVCEVYDDYALCYNYESNKYFRAYYTKNDETDSIEITERVDAYVLDVTEDEYEVLKRLGEISNNSYALIEEEVNAYREQKEKESTEFEVDEEVEEAIEEEVEAEEIEEVTEDEDAADEELDEEETEETEVEDEVEEIEEVEETEESAEPGTDYELEISKLNSQISELNSKIATYELENKELSEYKLNSENEKKSKFLSKYAKKLPKDIVEEFKAKLAEYELDAFKEKVSAKVLESVESNDDNIFGEEEYLPNGQFTSNEVTPKTAGERLLADFLKTKKN